MVPVTGIAQTAETGLEVNANVPDPLAVLEEETPLFLAVEMNGSDTGLAAEFLAHPSENRISIKRSELAEIGVKAPGAVNPRVYLDTIPGLTYRYKPDTQQIILNVPNGSLLPKVQSAARRPEYLAAEKSTGAVLNYSLGVDFGTSGANKSFGFNSLTLGLDSWVFTPYGTLSTTGAYRYSNAAGADNAFTRYETRYEISNASKALTLSVGDVKTSGMSWSRPIRIGGVQLRRDFSLRSDIVTEQLLSYSGAAAVPSTVDVFIDNNRSYTTSVGSGPFRIDDLPIYSGAGDAVIVVRDELGHAKKQKVSFFASQNLLKKGVADYSLEFGYARQAYGLESNNYGSDLVYSGSLRYGLTKNVTLEGHFEGKSDLAMASFGINVVPFSFAEVSLTGGVSDYFDTKAKFVQANFRTSIGQLDFNLNTMRAEDGFADLAYATGLDYLGIQNITSTGSLLEFPTAMDVVSVAVPMPFSDRKLGVSMVHAQRASSSDLLLSTSYGLSLKEGRGSINFNGSRNLRTDETTVSLGVSMSLGNRTYARSSYDKGYDGSTSGNLYLARSIGEKVGDTGYAVQLESQRGNQLVSARGDYRSPFGKGGLELQTGGGGTFARGTFEGSFVATKQGIAAGNPITDSFALVDVGVPDLPIYLQNRPVTRTNQRGKALVTGLSSHRRNRVSINVQDLSETANVGATAMDVVPARKSGMFVGFNGSIRPNVLVVLRYPNGDFLPAGTYGYLNGHKDETYVGYDGQAWLENVKGRNTIRFDTPRGACTATFQFEETAATQDLIDPVICK
ncbi:fimbria/pilus outer membrane usher protein [Lentibacter algarum]|uniref:fimbria/pilus outer membrane usher protein n=1 Tax=Lentibacter algarum TaxID=576131 RepID=UPI001C096301|nr:fimbria/pilus outer membrane usher protein [Lentibacter algarum]MBU2983077.1 fimbria/pilus outer membrane usher protein [Lentibacter algarum]